LSKALEEISRTLLKGPYTEKYPKEPSPRPEGFRGKPEFDSSKCTGCAACSSVCPADAIQVAHANQKRIVTLSYAKCLFCGKCQDACPEDAIKLTEEFELATISKDKAVVAIEIQLRPCKLCGKPVAPEPQLKILEKQLVDVGIPAAKIELSLLVCQECRGKIEAKGAARRIIP